MSSIRPNPNKITLGEIVGRHYLPYVDGSVKLDARTAFVRDQARRILHENIDIADRKFDVTSQEVVLEDFNRYFTAVPDERILEIQNLDEERREAALEHMAKDGATKIRQRIREIVIAERAKKAR